MRSRDEGAGKKSSARHVAGAEHTAGVSCAPLLLPAFSKVFEPWGPPQDYPAGTELFRQQAPAKTLYLVEDGIVKLSCTESGGNEVIVALRRRHWLLGSSALVLGTPYLTTATTLTACSLTRIPGEEFLRRVQKDAGLSWELNRILSFEIRSHLANVVALGCMSAAQRLRCLLFELVSDQEQEARAGGGRFVVPLRQNELAQMVAVTPQHLCRVLRALEEEGQIVREKGAIVIRDPALLKEAFLGQ